MNDRSPKRVVMGIEYQGLERRFLITGRRGKIIYDGFRHRFDAGPFLCGDEDGGFGIKTQVIFDLLFGPFDIGRRKIDFVDDRDNFKIVFKPSYSSI